MNNPTPVRRPLSAYPFVTVHPVRYGDLDPNDHVNNAVIATYFEIGRTEFFARDCIRLTGEGKGISLVRLAIDFHREILFPGSVQIAIGIERVGSASLRFDQAVFVEGLRHASAEAVVAQIDLAARRSTPWGEAQRARFAAMMMAD